MKFWKINVGAVVYCRFKNLVVCLVLYLFSNLFRNTPQMPVADPDFFLYVYTRLPRRLFFLPSWVIVLIWEIFDPSYQDHGCENGLKSR